MRENVNLTLKINSPSQSATIPQKLKQHIATWANVEYQKYSFGNILTQMLLNKLFHIYRLRFRMKKTAFVQLYRSHQAVSMLYCLNGSIQAMLPGTTLLSMQKDQFGFVYLPQGTRILQLAEETEIWIIDLEAEILEELAASRIEFKELVDLAAVNDPTSRILPLLSMKYMFHHILEDMRQCKQSGGNLLMELKTANLQLMNYTGKR